MSDSALSWGGITGWTGTFTGTYAFDTVTKQEHDGHSSTLKSSLSLTFSSTLTLSKRVDGQSWTGTATVVAHKVEDGSLSTDQGPVYSMKTETNGSGRSSSLVSLGISDDGTYGIEVGSVAATQVVTTDGSVGAATTTDLAFPGEISARINTSILPAKPGPISGSLSGGYGPSTETWTMTWNLEPTGGGPLSADISARPAKPRRGQPVTLKAVVANASKNVEYDWSFEAAAGNAIAPDSGDDSAVIRVRLLDDVVVKLKVTDGSTTVTTSKNITVAPRTMKTTVRKPIDDVTWDAGNILIESARYGVTHCAACDGSHAIHHANPDWSDVVAVEQLDDEGGPHHQFWWVSSARLQSQLMCHQNAYLRSATLADFPGQRKRDVAAIQKQVHDHEHAHATVSAGAVKAFDPGPALEKLTAPPTAKDFGSQVKAEADSAEEAIWTKTCDEASAKALLGRWARPGSLMLMSALDQEVERHTYPSMQDIGE